MKKNNFSVSSGSCSDEQVKLKKQSNKTFCLVKRLVTSAKGFLSWNEEKRKRIQKEEKYVRFLLEETGAHLPVHHGHIFCNLDMDCFAMVVLLQFLTAVVCYFSRDLPAIYLAVGCTRINHKCRDVAEGRLAYMINLADTATHFFKSCIFHRIKPVCLQVKWESKTKYLGKSTMYSFLPYYLR